MGDASGISMPPYSWACGGPWGAVAGEEGQKHIAARTQKVRAAKILLDIIASGSVAVSVNHSGLPPDMS